MDNQVTRDLSEIMRDKMVIADKIVALLRKEPQNIPQVAENLGYPSHEVVRWMMDMWRYGVIEETGNPDEDGYYQYQLK